MNEKVLKYFGLTEEPFTISPDPRYLYFTPQHKQALFQCKYTIENRQGLAVVAGDIGTGKTTVSRHIFRHYHDQQDKYRVALIVNPDLKTETAFLRAILEEFGVAPKRSHADSMKSFRRHAIKQYREDKKNLVIFVDEAQLMTPSMMEVVRSILNFESDRNKFVQIILFGQNELLDMLDSKEMRPIKSRVSTFAYLTPLDDDAVEKMIAFRWKAAGGDLPHPFPLDAIQEISKHSKGLPREIIRLCNLSLLRAYSNDRNQVHPTMVTAAAKELRMKGDE